ncbi:MBL fold metallo-hydrolase [[Mycobacterium] burgundiense]|uniref:MBL fold metallo-hydrolase n=1 Tax=[Mycobacterium] burgundiense TaxID=3064286 RepID=A0ABM9LHE4_9MYCO|nr:MBL fold metallo-hydrolase [Mycolicibacterium sp. MU0053]CAJ1499096.1 MBL fold metallo-hydrolase [Mycolicibacterium sp. MU0053]
MTPTSTNAPDSDHLQRIAPRVVRVQLPLPLPDLKVINAYIVEGTTGITLVDPGWSTAESEAQLLAALHSLGYGRSDVERILVTHAHWDHYTLAVKWRDELGAELMLGAGERHSIEAFDAAEGIHPVQRQMLLRAGAPDLSRVIQQTPWEPYEHNAPFAPPDRWLHGGERIDCGGTQIVARSTPGHTRGHVVYEDEAAGLVFTGDHLLPRITPSIAFERTPERLPLRSFLASLRLFVDLPDHRMLPAHGGVDNTTAVRAAELIEHHRERLTAVADLVATNESATAYDIAAQMRWTRHERLIAELNPIHRMVAVLEVMAHLDLLVHQGVLAVDESQTSATFTLA